MTARPVRGFVLGKFMPPHNGHVYLCDFGRAYCERLTILVCSLPDDPIPGRARFEWMQALFPDCDVRWCEEDLPQEPKDHPDFWPIWRDVVRRYGGASEVVFASEAYGQRLADEVGARFVPVDPERNAVPTSGTAVREDPFGCWDVIPAPVRPWFVKRLCLFGPESTGKSTLATALARRFETVIAPEYGRTYTETFGTQVEAADLHRIVAGHRAGVAAAKRQARRLLIEDTDPLLTSVWCEMLTGERDAGLDAFDDLADHYLLLGVGAPWTDDGTRYFPDLSDRTRFLDLCVAALERKGARWTLIDGADWAEREAAAIAATLDAFPALAGLSPPRPPRP